MRTRPFTSAAAKLTMDRLSSDQMPSTRIQVRPVPGPVAAQRGWAVLTGPDQDDRECAFFYDVTLRNRY